jgi:leucyl aminopeptidase
MSLTIQTSTTSLSEVSTDVLAIVVGPGVDARREPLASLDAVLDHAVAKAIEREEFKGKRDQSLELVTLGRIGATRLMLVGTGSARPADHELRAAAARAARAANGAKARTLAIAVPKGIGGERLRSLAEGVVLGAYRFTKYLTGDRRPKAELERATLLLFPRTPIGRREKHAVELGRAIGDAVCLARDLVNEPGNELFPAKLADEAQKTAKRCGLGCKVFDRREIERRGMKLLAAVGRGSAREPRFIHLSYVPRRPRHKLVLVGKGLTFDSGGLCIKPASGMGEMKTDMAGAANVVATLAACAALGAPVEVHGLIASAENMPDGDAYRPGDVFGSLDGKSVEIVNTDAEGRLVLADALAYGRALEPDLMVDNATLTGACIVALGKCCSGYFATSESTAAQFERAAKQAGEQFWRLPLSDDLKDQLKSDIADLKHTGDRWGGSITAALFLREFVGQVAWVHADIAGPVWAERATGFYPKGATGHGVLTLVSLVEQLAKR